MTKRKLIPIIMATLAVIAAAVIIIISLTGGNGYSGKVTYDGKGVADVSVTDGRNVVKTDKDGNFTLKGYRKTRFIIVTAPAGYTTENYYISADKNKSDGYNFELQKSSIKAGEAHKFIQISDTEINENGCGDWLESLKSTVKEEQPAFLVHTGDICYEAGLKRHKNDMNTETMGVPVRYVIGNHDYVDGKYGEELFESIYGPVWYSFEVGNVHYVVTPFQTGADYKSGYSKNDRWRWLANDLANTDKNMKVVMLNHTMPPNDDYVISYDLKKLDLKEHNLIAWAFGHYHYNYVRENNGVLNISTARPDCGGIDSSVSGARTINIAKDDSITTKMTYYDWDGNAESVQNASWSTKLNGNILYCNTVVDGDKVYVATVDDDYPRKCGVYCLSAEDGGTIWYYETKNSVKNNLIVKDGKIIAQDCEGNVYCLNADSGKKIWETSVKLGTSLNTSSAICTDGKRVYAGCAAYVTALDFESGETLWENNRKHGEASPAEFVIMGDKLIVSSHWDALVALNCENGKKLWQNKDEDIRFRSSTPVQVDDNTLLVADSDAIMLVDLDSGDITTKKDYADKYNFASSAKPYIKDNKAIIPTAKNGLVIFDLDKKEIVKEVAVGKAIIYTAPYTSDDSQTIEPSLIEDKNGNLVFGASDGIVYTINTNGDILKKDKIGVPIYSSAAEYKDSIIVSDFSGRVSRINHN